MSATRLLLRPNSVVAGWAALCNGNVTVPALLPPSPYCISSAVSIRHMSEVAKSNGRCPFLVDTLMQGVPSNHAEASKEEMEKSGMIQDSEKDFKVQSSQEYHFSLSQCEIEKLKSDIGKMHIELRRIHDELAKLNAQTTYLKTKFDQETHAIRDQLGVIGFFGFIFVVIPGIISWLV